MKSNLFFIVVYPIILALLALIIVLVFRSFEKPKGDILPDGAFIDNSQVDEVRIDPWCLTHECKG